MNSNRFNELLERYLEDTATAEERAELMQLIHEGNHDKTFRDSIRTMLAADDGQEDMDSARARKMLEGIVNATHETGRVVPMRTTVQPWKWVAAAAALVIAVTVGWRMMRVDPQPYRQIALHEERTGVAVFSGKQFLRLPDGSTVLLNEGSELRYSASFGTKVREVTLSGEGYFDVEHDPSKPFKVFTGKITTTVLGTAFNVKAYPGQTEIKVTVTRGKVEVGDDRGAFGVITPNEEIAVNTTTNDFVKTTRDTETAKNWMSQYLILDDVSMEEAVEILVDKYDVDIALDSENLKNCRISATFLRDENLEQVLTVVSGVIQATYTIMPNGDVLIKGSGCELYPTEYQP